MNLRVIAGKYRHRLLQIVDSPTTRPTKDRVREALFSSIHTKVIDATCLDLFAGSGALGIEAISRGAKACYFNEFNHQAYKILEQNTKIVEEECALYKKDYLELVRLLPQNYFDIVFLDPPYDFDANLVVNEIIKANIMKNDAVFVIETNKEFQFTGNHDKIKKYKYGISHITIIWR